MKIEVNIQKRYFFGILVGILLLGGIIAVYATYANPNTGVGHDISEIDSLGLNHSIGNVTNDLILSGMIDDYLQNLTVSGALNCFNSPLYDSINVPKGFKNATYFTAVPVPSGCIGSIGVDLGCVIVEQVYKNDTVSHLSKLVLVRKYGYTQSSDGYWSSEFAPGPFINGDPATSTRIIPSYGGITLFDDGGTGQNLDHTSANWFAMDASATYGAKIYVCTYND